jgi:histidinol-phosphate aminotransferase
MYKLALQSHGRRFTEVPMADYRYDLEAMAAHFTARTRIVFLANPDNPTGTAFGRAELETFLSKVPPQCLVVLDEAYFEYVHWPEYPNGMDYFRKLPNLVVLRTFSKIYGLAGVRLGYGIMQSQLTGYLHRTRMPFNLSSLAQAGGVAALDDLEHVRTARETAIRGLQYLEQELLALGLKVPKSHANFVFAEFGRSAKPIYEQLLRQGIITRPLPSYGFPNALRISVGLASQNERLVAALKQVL